MGVAPNATANYSSWEICVAFNSVSRWSFISSTLHPLFLSYLLNYAILFSLSIPILSLVNAAKEKWLIYPTWPAIHDCPIILAIHSIWRRLFVLVPVLYEMIFSLHGCRTGHLCFLHKNEVVPRGFCMRETPPILDVLNLWIIHWQILLPLAWGYLHFLK